MNWRLIFYRNISEQCPVEKFIDGLPNEDAKEVVASIAALRELGNKARRPLADYLEDGIYELRARRLKKTIQGFVYLCRQTNNSSPNRIY